jgi:hypothetical protein
VAQKPAYVWMLAEIVEVTMQPYMATLFPKLSLGFWKDPSWPEPTLPN